MQGMPPPPMPQPEASPSIAKQTDAPAPAAAPTPAPQADVAKVQADLASLQVDAKPTAPKAEKAKEPVQPKAEPKPDAKPAPTAEPQPALAQPAVQEAVVQQRQKPTVPGAAPGRAVAHKVPVGDYDFESANARFQKTQAAPAKLDAIPPAAETPTSFYDKKSGFFDNISSEVKDRHERRGPNTEAGAPRERFVDEQARNMQTFGDNAAGYRGAGRGRGRSGRGRRGRGRGRGRGGGSKPEWAD